jgi:hypothetical protein
MTKLRVITSPSGARFTVADEHADRFGGLVKDLEDAGIRINPNASGGYNPRNIRGSNKPSNHAFGRAIDINWDENPMGQQGKINPEVARSLAAKHGMTWGGDWKNRPDPMHFEVAGVPNVPLSQRAFTRVAGVQQTEPSTTGVPTPMPTYKNVGGQTYMGPEAAQQSRRLAEMLINQGTNQEPMTHWTQALGKMLMTGSGALRNDMAMRDIREGQAAGNQALADQLMGNDPTATQRAMTNPYSAGAATKYTMEQNDPLYKLKLQKAQADLENPSSSMPANVQEWEYFSKLPKDKQQQYIQMKRQIPFLDLGTSRVQPNLVDPTAPPVQTMPINVAGKQAQEEIGIAQGKSAAAAQGDISAADTALELVSSLRKDPNRERGTGMSSMFNFVPGTKGKDFQRKVDQASAGAFLTAIQQLRGMGALSNAEGQTATAAVTRMATDMSEEGFIEALNDYERLINKGKKAAASRLGSVPGAMPQGGGKEFDFDPATGKLVPR